MGLAEPKRKKKFTPSHLGGASDWASTTHTSSVAFKLMSSMGWAPGKGLGNGFQGETDNIKVALKDDLLGLGAKKEYGGGLWRGTTEVDDLYRRLEVGGVGSQQQTAVKVEEVKPEIKMRGGWKMRFLEGDTYTSSFSTEVSTAEVSEAEAPSSVEVSSGEVKVSKKRKREAENGEKKRSKKEKIDKKSKSKEQVDTPASESTSEIEKARRKKDKKRSKAETATSKEQDESAVAANISEQTPIASTKKEKKLKKDKKDRKTKSKDEKTDAPEKQKKRKDKTTAIDGAVETRPASDSKSPSTATPISEPTISAANSDRLEPIPRHMHRARFLAMKRASVMDPNALREILGVTG